MRTISMFFFGKSIREIFFLQKSCYFILIAAASLVFSSSCVFGYDFSDVQGSLKHDHEKWQGHASRGKIAIVYNYSDREIIKKKYNLVQLKKDFSRELLKSFDVADPIIVQEIISSNKLDYQQLIKDKSVLQQFADRTNSSNVLFVDLVVKESVLMADIKLVTQDNEIVSQVLTEIAPESRNQVSYESTKVVAQASEPEKSVLQTFDMNFGSRSFTAGQNDAWVYLLPTALMNPETHALNLALWFKDISEVDIRPVQMSYDIKAFEVLQLGLQSYAISELKDPDSNDDEKARTNRERDSGFHSVYASIKYLIVDENVLPINIAIGLRGRLYWDDDNTDFRSRNEETDGSTAYKEAEDTDEKNSKLNQLTLQAMITGKIKPMGILYNLYLDNMSAGAGIKFVLTPDIKLFFDGVYYFYENARISGDSAFGVQFYNSVGSTNLVYHVQTGQGILGVSLNF